MNNGTHPALEERGWNDLFQILDRQRMILNEAQGTALVVDMFLEVVLEDGVSLLCGVVLPRC